MNFRNIYYLFFIATVILLFLAIISLVLNQTTLTTVLMIFLGIAFGGLWFTYFYRVWKIEKTSIKVTKLRNLTEDEIKSRIQEIKKVKNSVRNTLVFSLVLLVSVYFFIKGFSYSEEFKMSVNGILFSWVLLIGSLAGLIGFVFNLSKVDRKRGLEKDFKEGVVRIEGKLFRVTMSLLLPYYQYQLGLRTTRSLRMGKYYFGLRDDRLKDIHKKLTDGEPYFIEFYAGTKKVLNIGKL